MIYLFVKCEFCYSWENLFSINDRTISFNRGYNGVSQAEVLVVLLAAVPRSQQQVFRLTIGNPAVSPPVNLWKFLGSTHTMGRSKGRVFFADTMGGRDSSNGR